MKIIPLLAACFALSAPAFAALPPLYQSLNEMKAILNSPELSQKLHSGELLVGIEKNKDGYEVITNQHRLQVNVIYKQTGKIGPAEFDLQFEQPHEASRNY